jgi:hypothetical protein
MRKTTEWTLRVFTIKNQTSNAARISVFDIEK